MRYLITGGSGYIGGRLAEELVGREETELVVLADVRPPAVPRAKTEFVQMDVRNGAGMRSLLEAREIDALVHLAFILNPIRDEALMYDIDVNGTQATLDAASQAGIQQVLVASSAVAYGAWPDNPRPIAEDHPLRGVPDFSYARDKTDSDRICQLWALEHPDRVMTIVRPCIVYGPTVDNYLFRIWQNTPQFPILDGVDEEVQYVHVDDVAAAMIGLLDARAGGAFNVTGDGTMSWRECAELVGIKTRDTSFKFAYRLSKLMWRLRMPRTEAPPGNLHYVRYPWVCSNEKLKATIDWQPRTTREVFTETMRAKGLMPGEGAGVPAAPAAPVA